MEREGGGDGVMEVVEVGEKQTLPLATGVQTLLEREGWRGKDKDRWGEGWLQWPLPLAESAALRY